MKCIITLSILLITLNPANAQERSIYDCISGALAPTPTYVQCPQDLRPDVAEAKLGYRTNRVLIDRANGELARLRRNAKGNESRIAALEAAVAQLEARANCDTKDVATAKLCYDAQALADRALRGEVVALKALEKGSVKMEILQGAGNGSPGYVFSLETPTPTESPLAQAAFDARLSLANDTDLQPIDHLGALGAIGFTLGGALIGGAIGWGLGDEGSTQTLPNGTVDDDDGDEGKKALIGAGIGAASGLALYGLTELGIALTNSSRAETRRRLVATPGGMAVAF